MDDVRYHDEPDVDANFLPVQSLQNPVGIKADGLVDPYVTVGNQNSALNLLLWDSDSKNRLLSGRRQLRAASQFGGVHNCRQKPDAHSARG